MKSLPLSKLTHGVDLVHHHSCIYPSSPAYMFSRRYLPFAGPAATQSPTEFALLIFIGMTIFNLFSECALRRRHDCINTNYVENTVSHLKSCPGLVIGQACFICFFVVRSYGLPSMDWQLEFRQHLRHLSFCFNSTLPPIYSAFPGS